MSKIEELTTVTAGYPSIQQLGDNFDKITTAFDNTLSRDGSTPNNMEAELDMNSNKIINLADGVDAQDAVTVGQINTLLGDLVDLGTGLISTDLTLTVATSGGDYTKLSDALDYLRTKVITGSVTIECGAGTFTETSTIELDHPDGARINITGEFENITVSSVQSIGNVGAANHSVVLNLASVANCAVGNYIKLRGLTGAYDVATLEGCWEITNVDTGNSRVTILVTDQRATINTSTTITAHSEARVIKTILQFNGVSAFAVRTQIGNVIAADRAFAGCVIRGDGVTTSARGFIVYDGAQLYLSATGCGVVNFGTKAIHAIRAGIVTVDYVAFCNNGAAVGDTPGGVLIEYGGHLGCIQAIMNGNYGFGLNATNCTLEAATTIICGNVNGVLLSRGVSANLEAATLAFNTTRGILNTSSMAAMNTAVVKNNGNDGIQCLGGSLRFVNGYATDNASEGVNCLDSMVVIEGATITGNTSSGVDLRSCHGHVTTSTITGNGGRGLYCINGGSMLYATGNTINSNSSNQVESTEGSYINLGTSAITGNVVANTGGRILATSVTGSPTYSPAANVVNDSGSLIDTGIATTYTGVQPLDSTLTALAAYNTNGILTQTAADTFTGRTFAGTTDLITVTNGDGVAGNPTATIASAFLSGFTKLFTAESKTIASDAVTLTSTAMLTILTVDTEAAAATDNLSTISGGVAGQILIVKSTSSSRDVTLVDSASLNLSIASGNFTLAGSNHTCVLYCVSSGVWTELTRNDS